MSESLVIYSMNKVGKIVPPNKQILRDISLGFYYGAKIGVLGLNGAGKSHVAVGESVCEARGGREVRNRISTRAERNGWKVSRVGEDAGVTINK